MMGFKGWLAKNVVGVSGYGSAMGRAAVGNGIVLGQALYLSHGSRERSTFLRAPAIQREGSWFVKCSNALVGPFNSEDEALRFSGKTFGYGPGPVSALVFEDDKQMEGEGFTPTTETEDSLWLQRNTQAAGIAFCVCCSITAASSFMNKQNAQEFNHSLKAGSGEESAKLHMRDLVNKYLELPDVGGIKKIIELDKPGAGDFLEAFFARANALIANRAVGFQRGGVSGFAVVTKRLAEETAIKILEASQKFQW